MANNERHEAEPSFDNRLTTFDDSALFDALASRSPSDLDELAFGVVGLRHGGEVVAYNRFEQSLAGLAAADVIGRNFFTDVAPCTNNFMVSERFHEAWQGGSDLDEQIPYTFSYRMKPTRVVLRMLVRKERAFLVVRLA